MGGSRYSTNENQRLSNVSLSFTAVAILINSEIPSNFMGYRCDLLCAVEPKR